MASVSDVVNLALAHLAEKANVVSISPPDNTQNAQYAARFYPIARDALLEAHDWSFNTKRVTLAEVDLGDDQPSMWQFAYTFPNDCIKVRRVLEDTSNDNIGADFKVELAPNDSRVIYTNVDGAVAVINVRTTDTGKFSPMFVNALSWLLASYLAGPITKDFKIKQAVFQAYKLELALATSSDSNAQQSSEYTNRLGDSAMARL